MKRSLSRLALPIELCAVVALSLAGACSGSDSSDAPVDSGLRAVGAAPGVAGAESATVRPVANAPSVRLASEEDRLIAIRRAAVGDSAPAGIRARETARTFRGVCAPLTPVPDGANSSGTIDQKISWHADVTAAGRGYVVVTRGAAGWLQNGGLGRIRHAAAAGLEQQEFENDNVRYVITLDTTTNVLSLRGLTFDLDSGNVILVDRIDARGGPPVAEVVGCLAPSGSSHLYDRAMFIPAVKTFAGRRD